MAGKVGFLAGGLSASEGHSHLMGPQQLSAATCATMTRQQQEMLTQLATAGPGRRRLAALADAGGQCACLVFKTVLRLQTHGSELQQPWPLAQNGWPSLDFEMGCC